jgi:hypothetical protein
MKRLSIIFILFTAVACSNPEDKATGQTTIDSTAGYNEDNTLNSSPGPTAPDSASKAGLDNSQVDTMRKNP